MPQPFPNLRSTSLISISIFCAILAHGSLAQKNLSSSGSLPKLVDAHSCSGSHRTPPGAPGFSLEEVRMSSPVAPGSAFILAISGTLTEHINCSRYIGRVTLAKRGLEFKSGEDSLCSFMQSHGGMAHEDKLDDDEDDEDDGDDEDDDDGVGSSVRTRFSLRISVDVPGGLEGDLYQCFFEVLRRGSGDLSCKVPEEDNLACVEMDQVVTNGIQDTLSSMVAFGIAAAASWHLGKAFCMIRLPLITGYLFIGIIVGPYVTDLVSQYYIWLLGPALNDVALSFISFAAGEEIFFPSLSKLMTPILRHTVAVCCATLLLTLAGMVAGSFTQAEAFLNGLGVPCQVSIAALLATIMMARSPASVVAVLQEVGAAVDPRASQLLMGITVMSDVVVLVGFAIVTAVASATCPKHEGEAGTALSWTEMVIIVGQFVAIVAVGAVVGKLLVGILAIPFQRLQIRTFTVYRSYMKGALIIPLGFLVMQLLRFIADESRRRFGTAINIEPLMVCMIGASFASHNSTRRRQFANILEKTSPYIFLPFFTLTGASLNLTAVLQCLPLACLITFLRVISILIGSRFIAASSYAERQVWLTLISQAGVALGLALEVASRFPRWGEDLKTLVLSIVVINQVIGPPLCKCGLLQLKGPNVPATPPAATQPFLLSEADPITISPYIRRTPRCVRRSTAPMARTNGQQESTEDGDTSTDGSAENGGESNGNLQARYDHQQPPSAYLFVSNADNG